MLSDFQLQIGLLVGTGLCLAWLYRAVRRETAADRVLVDHGLDVDDPSDVAVRSAVAAQIPTMKFRRDTIRKELRAAGFYRPTAYVDYAFARNMFVGAVAFIGLAIALLVPREWSLWVIAAVVILMGLGFSAPYAYLVSKMNGRRASIERGLPVAIDLLVVGLTAGQDLLTSIRWASQELKSSHPAIAEEFALIGIQTKLGNFESAMEQFADRVQVPQATHVARVLSQSQRLGTNIIVALQEMAHSFRTTMRQEAESRANRLGFWMLLPNVFCLFLACAIAAVGPAVVHLRQVGNESRDMLSESRLQIEEIQPNTP